MKIIIGEFVITNSFGIGRFDIYKRSTIQTGKNTGKELEVAEAYGVNFDRCIQIILHHRLDRGLGDIGLEKFLEEYESMSSNLISEVKAIFEKAEK